MEENDTLERESTHSAPSETPEARDAVAEPPAPEDNKNDSSETGAAADSPAGEKPPEPKEEKEPGPSPAPAKPPDKESAEPPEDPEAALKRWIAEDAAAFVEAYPEADLAKLDGDARFRRFCGSRYGREPLKDLYADWLELTGAAAREAAARSASKSERSTGTGGGAGADTLTAAQQRDLDEWNRSFPNMRMTAKEYLSR